MPALVPVWAASGAIQTPDSSKIAQGWFLAEKPPHEWMNWWMNLITQRLNHILLTGVPGWDASVTYPVGAFTRKSGILYRALTENANTDPNTSPSDWLQITQNATALTTGSVPNGRLTGNYTNIASLELSGNITANKLIGDGSGLTNLDASDLASGAIPNARLSGSYTNVASLTASGVISAAGFAGSGAGLTNLNAGNLSTGTLPNNRLSGSYSFAALTLSGAMSSASASVTNSMTVGGHITVTGNVAANNFAGSGLGLTALDASALTQGTLSNGRLAGNYSFNNLTLTGALTADSANVAGQMTVGGSIAVTGNVAANKLIGDGAQITAISASNVTAGTLAAARLATDSAANAWVGARHAAQGPYTIGISVFAFDAVDRDTSFGQTRNGGDLYPGNADENVTAFGSLGAGTVWRCLGRTTSGLNQDARTTLWQRQS